MNCGFRDAFMNQDFAVVFLFADKANTKPFHPVRGTNRLAYPHFGCVAQAKDLPGFFGAVRQAPTQNQNYVRPRQLIIQRKPAACMAKSSQTHCKY